jgi:hypothetical protein
VAASRELLCTGGTHVPASAAVPGMALYASELGAGSLSCDLARWVSCGKITVRVRPSAVSDRGHVTLAATSLGSRAREGDQTSATYYSGPRRSANHRYGAAAVGEAVLADRAEEHARELSVAVTPDDDEIGGRREGLEHRRRMPLDN